MPTDRLEALCTRLQLPKAYLEALDTVLRPLASQIATHQSGAKSSQGTLYWGISGAQGTGKSTLAQFLATLLSEVHGLRVACLSIDDFYLSRDQRKILSHRIHPLLRTRGVPGTHDVEAALTVFSRLQRHPPGASMVLPGFCKARDDSLPAYLCPTWTGPCDVVLFEGWCVGTIPQPEALLAQPVNELESVEDADGVWRSWVNRQLAGPYSDWWEWLDGLYFLAAPGFEQIMEWRLLQEQKLRERLQSGPAQASTGLMDEHQIARFIQHYQRLTEWNLQVLPARATQTIPLRADHQFGALVPGHSGNQLELRRDADR